MSTSSGVSHPVFARLYPRMQRTAAKRGESAHRVRLLEGLRGRVFEIGAGYGANFEHYPTTLTTSPSTRRSPPWFSAPSPMSRSRWVRSAASCARAASCGSTST